MKGLFALGGNRSLASLVLAAVAIATVAVGVILVLLGLGLPGAANPLLPDQVLDRNAGLVLIAVGTAGLAWTVWGRRRVPTRWTTWDRIVDLLIAWNVRDDELSQPRRILNLFLISFLGLFFELALIRWLAAEIKVFAYLKNVVLIAAFLGLGIGFFMSRRRAGWLPLFLPLAVILVGTLATGNAFHLWDNIVLPNGNQLVLVGVTYNGLFSAPLFLQLVVWIPYYAITIFYFSFVVLLFIPLGQYSGKCMRSFDPIPAYSLNLLGSLAGTLAFTLFAFAWSPPFTWFALAALIAVFLLVPSSAALWRVALGSALLLLFLVRPDATIWSPYHNLRLSPMQSGSDQAPWGYQLGIGSYYYQEMLNLSPAFFDQHLEVPKTYEIFGYQVPYRFAKPEQVLVLGAGTGNDVAMALQNGAGSIDAVDIDAAIMQIGEQYHPERPYQSPRVTRIVDDARSYIRKSTKTYDLVVFGFLDSQQVLSAFGSVRLDNFVYTVEGMREAFARVKPGGVLAVCFQIFEPWIAERIDGILFEATGQRPTIIKPASGQIFLVRKGSPFTQQQVAAALSPLSSTASQLNHGPSSVPLTTDDWPFLYLHDREIPLGYLSILPILGLVAIGMLKRASVTGQRNQWHFFFLGSAFMVMEVRVIGQVALLFGSTWVVNAVAIAAILLMAVSANLLIAWRKSENMLPSGILLLVTLIVSSLVPSSTFLTWDRAIGGIAAALILALPVFFASMVFSIALRKTGTIDTALAMNLAGSILGGFAEYLSLLWGIGSLGWMAALFYGLALVLMGRRHSAEQVAELAPTE